MEKHLDAVYRLVGLRLGPANAAVDDVVQETLIGAVNSVARLRGDDEAAFVRWLLTIARFKVADHYRSLYARPEARPREESAGQAISPDPEDVAAARAQGDQLRRALGELTPEQEEIITLKYVLGYSNEEVAAITGRTVGAVKSMQHRGLATMERLLGTEAETWD